MQTATTTPPLRKLRSSGRLSGSRGQPRSQSSKSLSFLRSKESKERQELRDRLRLAILTNDRATIDEVCGDERWGGVKDLDKPDQNGRTAILNAAFVYQLDLCLEFLDAGACVTALEPDTGSTMLHYLAKAREPASDDALLTLKTILHAVLGRGCLPDARDADGRAALHYAARVGNVNVVSVLLQHGAFVNIRSSADETPLHLCVIARPDGWIETALALLNRGADPLAVDGEARTPLATVQGTTQGAEVLARMRAMRTDDVAHETADTKKGARKVVAVGALAAAHETSAAVHRVAAELDRTLIAVGDSEHIHVDYGQPGLRIAEVVVQALYAPYQAVFFERTHFLFVGRVEGAGSKIVAVMRAPDATRQAYYALLINRHGAFDTWLPQTAVLGAAPAPESPRDLEPRLLAYLREHWSTSAIDWMLLDSRVGMSAMAALERGDSAWEAVSATKSDLPCLLLALECRLGLSKRITVGVVFNTGGQTEEDAFRNTAGSARFTRLMRVLAARVPLAGWRHFDGGVSATQAQEIYYTSWRGFEVVFHVAHELGGEARRQHLGNDKCLIHYCEAGGGPVRPEFRGHVNSVALVVTCLDESESLAYGNQHMAQWGCPAELWGPGQAEQPVAWRVAAFSRRRVTNFRPCVTTSLIRDPDVLRDIVLANVVNATACVSRSPPYSHNVDTLFAEETERIVERFLPAAATKRRQGK